MIIMSAMVPINNGTAIRKSTTLKFHKFTTLLYSVYVLFK
jgi:hypothetical protein